MVRSFTAHLPGIRGQEVVGTVQPAPHPITVGDTRYALSRHPRVKGIVTGPSTLAHALHVSTPSYRDRGDLAMDLARALAVETAALERAGVCMVQVDEPIFSTGAADLDAGARALDLLTSRVTVPVALHVCGELSGVIDRVLAMPVAVLDIECARSPSNLALLAARELREKRIGLGCVDSSTPRVDTAAEIAARIRTGIDTLGPENLLIDPDCGLRMLTRESALAKLSHMTEAAREIRAELGKQ
jgi:5-methyltetrahydropteroyltriglutamate--homocysteine methyltransferase